MAEQLPQHGDVFTIAGIYRPRTRKLQQFEVVMRPNPTDLTLRNLHKTRKDVALLRAQLRELVRRVNRLDLKVDRQRKVLVTRVSTP